MRIDSFRYLNQCGAKQYSSGAADQKAERSGKRNCDTVSFSAAAQQRAEAMDSQLLEQRAEQVERIKQQVVAGTYSVSSRAVVDKMCDSSRDYRI